ncbi:MAG: NADH-quinone oxidoreductase subunit N [Anaerolineaceae bacterium]|nr:NADH-quinone oxidoreductase subunit N [Anaerolineaceae bacterium]
MIITDLNSILPVIVLIAWALITLLLDVWFSKRVPALTPIFSAVGLTTVLVLILRQFGHNASAFNDMIRVDGFSTFLSCLFVVSGIVSILLGHAYLKRVGIREGEYYVLLMISISGMLLMASAADLIIVFLALELLSIPLYVLTGIDHKRIESKEAALKYFLLGTMASAFVLFGISFVYGATATTKLIGVVDAVTNGTANLFLLVTGAALLLGGFGFKVAAVPFHSWTPDVYHGAPSPVTAFMSVGAKAAGFAALLRVFSLDFTMLSEDLLPIFWVLAAATMILGNVAALAQTNLKRMLAYSSIAHAGYILMAFVGFGDPQVLQNSVASALFYLAAYAFTSLGAWAVVVAVEKNDGSGNEINDLTGLGKSSPALAAAMTVFMLSFTGIPLTLGFWGKFYLFRTAIQGGFIWLAVLGLLTSLVSAYYYLRVVVKMFFVPGEAVVQQGRMIVILAVVLALIVVGMAFVPGWLFDLAAAGVIAGF